MPVTYFVHSTDTGISRFNLVVNDLSIAPAILVPISGTITLNSTQCCKIGIFIAPIIEIVALWSI